MQHQVEAGVFLKPRWRALLAAALLFCSVCLSACGGERQPIQVDLGGLTARCAGQRERALLCVFWATWCEPCVAEIPDLIALHAENAANLEIVAVSLDAFLAGPAEATRKVAGFLDETPVPYENLVFVGSQDELFTRFEMPGGIPYAILYDRDGRVRERFAGRVNLTRLQDALEHEALREDGNFSGSHDDA